MKITDQRLKDHYTEQTLPDDLMSELVEHAQLTDPKLTLLQRLQSAMQSSWLQAAMLSVCVLVVSISIHKGGVHAERTDRALKEVAMNHSTRLDLEFCLIRYPPTIK